MRADEAKKHLLPMHLCCALENILQMVPYLVLSRMKFDVAVMTTTGKRRLTVDLTLVDRLEEECGHHKPGF